MKISVHFVKTGESLDIPEQYADVVASLVTPDGAYLAVETCEPCADCSAQADATVAPAADAPAAS